MANNRIIWWSDVSANLAGKISFTLTEENSDLQNRINKQLQDFVEHGSLMTDIVRQELRFIAHELETSGQTIDSERIKALSDSLDQFRIIPSKQNFATWAGMANAMSTSLTDLKFHKVSEDGDITPLEIDLSALSEIERTQLSIEQQVVSFISAVKAEYAEPLAPYLNAMRTADFYQAEASPVVAPAKDWALNAYAFIAKDPAGNEAFLTFGRSQYTAPERALDEYVFLKTGAASREDFMTVTLAAYEAQYGEGAWQAEVDQHIASLREEIAYLEEQKANGLNMVADFKIQQLQEEIDTLNPAEVLAQWGLENNVIQNSPEFLKAAEEDYNAIHGEGAWAARVEARKAELTEAANSWGFNDLNPFGQSDQEVLDNYNPQEELISWAMNNIRTPDAVAKTAQENLHRHAEFLKATEADYNSIHGEGAWQTHVNEELNKQREELKRTIEQLSQDPMFEAVVKDLQAELDTLTADRALARWGLGRVHETANQMNWERASVVGLDPKAFDQLDAQNPVPDNAMYAWNSENPNHQKFARTWLDASETLYNARHGEGAWARRVAQEGWDAETAMKELAAEGESAVQWFESNLTSAATTSLFASNEEIVALLYLQQLNAYTESTWEDMGNQVIRGVADPTMILATTGGGYMAARFVARRALMQAAQNYMLRTAGHLGVGALGGSFAGSVEGYPTEYALGYIEKHLQLDNGIIKSINFGELHMRGTYGALFGAGLGSVFGSLGGAFARRASLRSAAQALREQQPAQPSAAYTAFVQQIEAAAEAEAIIRNTENPTPAQMQQYEDAVRDVLHFTTEDLPQDEANIIVAQYGTVLNDLALVADERGLRPPEPVVETAASPDTADISATVKAVEAEPAEPITVTTEIIEPIEPTVTERPAAAVPLVEARPADVSPKPVEPVRLTPVEPDAVPDALVAEVPPVEITAETPVLPAEPVQTPVPPVQAATHPLGILNMSRIPGLSLPEPAFMPMRTDSLGTGGPSPVFAKPDETGSGGPIPKAPEGPTLAEAQRKAEKKASDFLAQATTLIQTAARKLEDAGTRERLDIKETLDEALEALEGKIQRSRLLKDHVDGPSIAVTLITDINAMRISALNPNAVPAGTTTPPAGTTTPPAGTTTPPAGTTTPPAGTTTPPAGTTTPPAGTTTPPAGTTTPEINRIDNPQSWFHGQDSNLLKDSYSDPRRVSDEALIGKPDPDLPFRRIRKDVDSELYMSEDPVLGEVKTKTVIIDNEPVEVIVSGVYKSLADFERGFRDSTKNFTDAIRAAGNDVDKINAAVEAYTKTLDKMDASTDHLSASWNTPGADADTQLARDGLIFRNMMRLDYPGYTSKNHPPVTAIQKIAVQESILDARALAKEMSEMAQQPNGAQLITDFLLGVSRRINNHQGHPQQYDSLIARSWTYLEGKDVPTYTKDDGELDGSFRKGELTGQYRIGYVTRRAQIMFSHELAEGAHAFTLGHRLPTPASSPNIEHKGTSKLISIIESLNDPKNTVLDSDLENAAEAIIDGIGNNQFPDLLYYFQRSAWNIELTHNGSITDPFRDYTRLLVKVRDRLAQRGDLNAYELGILKRIEAEEKILGDNPQQQLGSDQLFWFGEAGQDIDGEDLSGRAVRGRAAQADVAIDLLDGRFGNSPAGELSDAAQKVVAAISGRLWKDMVWSFGARLKDIDYTATAEARTSNRTGWRYVFSDDTGGFQFGSLFGLKIFPKPATLARIYGRWLTPVEGIVAGMKAIPDNHRILGTKFGRYLRTPLVTGTARWVGHTAWGAGTIATGGSLLWYGPLGLASQLAYQGTGAVASIQDAAFGNGWSWGWFAGDGNEAPEAPGADGRNSEPTSQEIQVIGFLETLVEQTPEKFAGVEATFGRITNRDYVDQVIAETAKKIVSGGNYQIDVLRANADTTNLQRAWNDAKLAVDRRLYRAFVEKRLAEAVTERGLQVSAVTSNPSYSTIIDRLVKQTTADPSILDDNSKMVETYNQIRDELAAEVARKAAATDGFTAWLDANQGNMPEFTDLSTARQNEVKAVVIEQLATLPATPFTNAILASTDNADLNAKREAFVNEAITAILTLPAPAPASTPKIEGDTDGNGDLSDAERAALAAKRAAAKPGTDFSLSLADTKSAASNVFNSLTDIDGDGVSAFIDTEFGRSVSGTFQQITGAATSMFGNLSQTEDGKQMIGIGAGVIAALSLPGLAKRIPILKHVANIPVVGGIAMAFLGFFLATKGANAIFNGALDAPGKTDPKNPAATTGDEGDKTGGEGDTQGGGGHLPVEGKGYKVKIQTHDGKLPQIITIEGDFDGDPETKEVMNFFDTNRDGVYAAQLFSADGSESWVAPSLLGKDVVDGALNLFVPNAPRSRASLEANQEIKVEAIDNNDDGQTDSFKLTIGGTEYTLDHKLDGIMDDADLTTLEPQQ